MIAEAPVGAVTVLISGRVRACDRTPDPPTPPTCSPTRSTSPVRHSSSGSSTAGCFRTSASTTTRSTTRAPSPSVARRLPTSCVALWPRSTTRSRTSTAWATSRPSELTEVKAQRAVNSAFGRERASGYAHTVGFWWSVASIEYYLGYVDNMASPDDGRPGRVRPQVHRRQTRVTGVLIAPGIGKAIDLTEADLEGGVAVRALGAGPRLARRRRRGRRGDYRGQGSGVGDVPHRRRRHPGDHPSRSRATTSSPPTCTCWAASVR